MEWSFVLLEIALHDNRKKECCRIKTILLGQKGDEYCRDLRQREWKLIKIQVLYKNKQKYKN